MGRVVISGYYGFRNLGDEAVLYSMIQELKKLDPGIEVVVLSNDPERTARAYGVEAVNRWKWREVGATIRGSDLLISGGGSLLQDVTGIKSLFYYLGVIEMAYRCGCPVMFYAQGIGPLRTRLGRWLTVRAANRAAAITVRDGGSRRDLLSFGVKVPVQLAADPVLALDPELVDRTTGTRLLRKAGLVVDGEEKLMGVSVRDWAGDDAWQEVVAGVCDEMVRQGWQVVFLPMQWPVDVDAARRVASLMREGGVVLEDEYGVLEMLSLIGNMNLLLGMRLHALIMAAVMGVPLVGIVYDPKVERFLRQLGRVPAGHVGEMTPRLLREAIEDVIANYDVLQEELAGVMEYLRSRARLSAEVAIGLVHGKRQ